VRRCWRKSSVITAMVKILHPDLQIFLSDTP
jgi:hypothetical protein